MKTVDNFDFSGKRALIRVDFNVPLNDQFEITDDTRLKAALPTIKKILGDGGSVVLMSHLGRPKSGPEEKFSRKHVVPYLSSKLGVDVTISVEIEAKSKDGFDEGLQRTIKENCNVLKFSNAEFEE